MKTEFFDKARENLNAAQICFDQGFYNACANRVYYAALHGAIAALTARGIKIEKIDHKLVQSEFNGRLIHRQKLYPAKLKAYLPDMQALRNTADYTTDTVSKAKVSKRLADLKDMLTCIEKEMA